MKRVTWALALGLLVLPATQARANVTREFGESVAVGDVNRDGFPDLVVGDDDAGEDDVSFAGRVYIYSGKDGRLLRTIDGADVDEGASSFGGEVAVGDVNRDGYADLVVVDPDSSSGEGNGLVHIFSGKNFRLLGTLEASVFGRFFNDISSVAVGDLNRDGYADIAVGDEDADADTATEDGKNGSFQDFEGAVAVVSGKTLRRVTQIDGSDWGDAGEFGQSIAIGDVTNHGGRELVVVDDRTGEGGAVFIFHLRSSDFHSAGGPRIRLRRVIDVISEVDGEMDDITGVACADLDGDGHADIILGDEDSADNGRVVVLSGKNFRVLARLDQERYDTDDGNEFGSAVSAVGRTKRARAFIVVADEDREITGSKVRHEGRIYLIAASKGNGLLGTIDGEGIDIRGRIRRR